MGALSKSSLLGLSKSWYHVNLAVAKSIAIATSFFFFFQRGYVNLSMTRLLTVNTLGNHETMLSELDASRHIEM